jgi:hypothetical protein|tara:strand:- start:883 stop:1077 length:195 start_codon:yes stop_codon:yes gene_type:complete
MFFEVKYENSLHYHHGDSINPDFAKWIVEFISSFSDNFLLLFFSVGFLIILFSVILILFLSRKK